MPTRAVSTSTPCPTPTRKSVAPEVFATSALIVGSIRSAGKLTTDPAETTPAASRAAANFVWGRTAEAFMSRIMSPTDDICQRLLNTSVLKTRKSPDSTSEPGPFVVRDLEVHAAHATGRVARRCGRLLRLVGDNGLRGQEQRR